MTFPRLETPDIRRPAGVAYEINTPTLSVGGNIGFTQIGCGTGFVVCLPIVGKLFSLERPCA